MKPVGGVASHALPHHVAERGECRVDVVADARVLRLDREAARRSMHLRADVLHLFRHVRRDFGGSVHRERAHAEAGFGDLRDFAMPPLEGPGPMRRGAF